MNDTPKTRVHDTSPWWPILVWLGPVFGISLFSIVPMSMIGTYFLLPGTPKFAWLEPLLIGVQLFNLGLLPAQVTLIGLCWALGVGTFWQRTFVMLITAMAAFQCGLLGYISGCLVIHFFPRSEEEMFFEPDLLTSLWLWRIMFLIACSLPLVLLGFQLPFTLMRIAFGWRLVRNDADNNTALPNKADDALSIRDLLLGTALVAVSLAVAQFEDRVLSADGHRAAQSYLFGLFTVVAIGSVVTTATVLPLTAVFLRHMKLPAAWSICGVLIAIVATLYVVPTFAMSSGLALVGLLVGVLFILTYYLAVACGLSLLRVYGWRLSWRERGA